MSSSPEQAIDRAPSASDRSVSDSRMPGKWWLFVVTTAVALAFDLFTKRLAIAALTPGERVELLPGLALQQVYNRGVAFGMLSGRSVLIGFVAAAAVLIILAYVAFEPRAVPAGIGGGLLLGGSLGNLAERLIAGQVTDFIRLPHWPNFNLADMFIVAGVAVIALYLVSDLLRRDPSPPR